MRIALVLGAALWVAAPSGDVYAQSVVPPTLLEGTAPEIEPPPLEIVVELVLVVDVTGQVTEATLAAPTGTAYDDAALAAARTFRFTPATRDGVPVPAKIRWAQTFAAAPPPPTAEDVPQFGARAKVTRPPPAEAATKRTLTGEILSTTAGTRGDALRTLELLPGVGRPPGGEGILLVRGSGPEDSQLFVDGAAVIRIYHFGGLTSFAPTRLIDRIDLFPGNFSVRYGRALGGAVEVRLRDPASDRLHAVADVNAIDAGAIVEGPLGDGWSIAAGARRSTIDLWFAAAAGDEAEITAAPVYLDYQLLLAKRFSASDHLRIQIYGSDDGIGLVLPPDDGDPTVRGALDQRTDFHRVQALWKHRYAETVEHELSATLGTFGFDFTLGPSMTQDIRTVELLTRAELRATLTPSFRLTGGTDLALMVGDVAYRGPRIPADEGHPDDDELGELPMTAIDETLTFLRPAAYLEAALDASDRLELTAGIRVDGYSELDAVTVDVRAMARYRLAEATRLKLAAGRFSQPPDWGEAIPALVGAVLGPEHAIHATVGVEQVLGSRFTVGVELYGKWLSNVIGAGEMDTLANVDEGRIMGAEVAARLLPGGPLSGMLSYSLSRSQRRPEGGDWRLFDHDQTHVLTLQLGWKIGRGWSAGLVGRLVSGNLETPVVGSVYDANRDRYRAVYGEVNSERAPLFRQLDLRVEKVWTLGRIRLAAYLDVQNATNAKNEESTKWSYDYRTRGAIYGLPILPALGLRGEL
jgi:TonB family protein